MTGRVSPIHVVVAATVAALAVTVGVAVVVSDHATTQVAAPNTAAWSVKCTYSGQAEAVDPIVSPGVTPSAHLHVFFGQAGITSTTSPLNLRNRATNTCISVSNPLNPTVQLVDNAAYWVPALYTTPAETTMQQPWYAFAYYRNAGKDPATIQPFPANLEMVAGDSHATAPQPAHVDWYCISQTERTTPQATIPASCPVANSVGYPYALRADVIFPDCWDGVSTPPNYTPHMAYAVPNPDTTSRWATVCPTGYTPIPQVQIDARWLLKKFPTDGTTYDLTGATLSSDSAPGGLTIHADFLSGWTVAELADLVTNCFHVTPPINCGAYGGGTAH